jgi:hypothetical protein
MAWPLAQYYCHQSYWVFILAISVQIIYVADHIFDVFQKKTQILSLRHHFIKQHLTIFIIILAILFLINIFLCLKLLNPSAILTGAGLCTMVFIYFYNNFSIKLLPKEILTAIIYAAGICVLPFNYTVSNCKYLEVLFLMFGISVCAFINLICNNLFEWNEDKTNIENSFGQKVGLMLSERILTILYFTSFSCFGMALFLKNCFVIEYSFSLTIISLIHLLIYKNKNSPLLIKYRRSLMEWSFAIPGLIYLWL